MRTVSTIIWIPMRPQWFDRTDSRFPPNFRFSQTAFGNFRYEYPDMVFNSPQAWNSNTEVRIRRLPRWVRSRVTGQATINAPKAGRGAID